METGLICGGLIYGITHHAIADLDPDAPDQPNPRNTISLCDKLNLKMTGSADEERSFQDLHPAFDLSAFDSVDEFKGFVSMTILHEVRSHACMPTFSY